MRLIDADALLNGFDVHWVTEYDEAGFSMEYKAVPVGAIENAPTIDAMPKWISVEERLPEDEQDVLVCVNKNTIDTGYCSFGYDPSVRNWWVYASMSNNVTHWMPLPEPPKEDT